MVKIKEPAVFTTLLLTVVGLCLYSSLKLSPLARIVPLTVLIPTLFLLSLQLMLDLWPGLAERYKKFQQLEIFSIKKIDNTIVKRAETVDQTDYAISINAELMIIGWILLLLTLIYLIGLSISIPIYLLLYLRFHACESWRLTCGLAAIIWILFYGLFIRLLDLHAYPGHLWQWLNW